MSWVRWQLGGLAFWQSPLLLSAGLPHAFTTRVGGVSQPPFDSLNLGLTTGDTVADVLDNRRALATALGTGLDSLRWVAQVHGHHVVAAAGACRGGEHEEHAPAADGLWTERVGEWVGVRTADCLPVLLATRDGRRVAAVHAGWRGLAGGVLTAAVTTFTRDGLRAETLLAAIGPGVGVECYEVSADVAERFPPAASHQSADGHWHLDLALAARLELQALGVGEIDTAGRCTVCGVEDWFSHRRDGARTGRQAALIACRG